MVYREEYEEIVASVIEVSTVVSNSPASMAGAFMYGLAHEV